MRFAIWEHAGKGGYLRQQLHTAGHQSAETLDECELLLVDCDWRWAHPRPALIQAAKNAGAAVALFPHGGQPTVFIYDGLTEPDPAVDLRLEHGIGSVELANLLGLELDQRATGWLYSPTQSFEPVEQPARVLFAPQHPNMETLLNGSNGHDPGPALNQRVYRDLLELGYELTVSIVGPAWRNGIWAHPRARIITNHEMLFHESYQQIMAADVVVGAGTIAATAVACGKPTVMLGQDNFADYVDGAYREPDHVDLYRDLCRYPLDAGDDDLDALIVRACQGDQGAAEWRDRWIGDDGTEAAVQLLEQLVHRFKDRIAKTATEEEEPTGQQHVFIEGVTAVAGTTINTNDDDEE